MSDSSPLARRAASGSVGFAEDREALDWVTPTPGSSGRSGAEALSGGSGIDLPTLLYLMTAVSVRKPQPMFPVNFCQGGTSHLDTFPQPW